ncbi:MAG: hypothetical protein OHK0046_52050 [Anaerolineae bacterium]
MKRLHLMFVLFVVSVLLVNLFPAAAQDAPITVTDSLGNAVVIEDASRIVTIGGAVTEVVFALGAGDRVIAVDDSSLYPAAALERESIGYLRFLTAEPILALEPTLIITTEDVGPAEVVQQLEDSGIAFLRVPAEDTVEGAAEKIRTIAAALDEADQGEALVETMLADIETAAALVAEAESAPRVMFLFLRGAAVLTVSGTGTGADEMIRLAGAENAVTDYEGYQPLTAEAVAAAAPDVILTTTNGLESVGGLEGLLELPGIALTPAAENGRIYATMDDLELLGFTPRLGRAVLKLTYQLHEELVPPIGLALEIDGRFTTFLQGVAIGRQEGTLNGDGPLTVFIPTDEAFATLPEGTVESLYSSAISVGFVFTNHYVQGQVLTADDLRAMVGETLQPMFFGNTLNISTNEAGDLVIDDVATVIDTIEAANGIIHVINAPMIPERPGR